MNKKFFLIILLVFLITVVLVIFFTQIRTKKEETISNQRFTQQDFVVPPPRTITFTENPAKAVYTYTGNNKSVPSKVLTYTVDENETVDLLYSLGMSLSDSLGLSATPTSTLRGDNFAFIRNDQYKWFSISKTKNVSNVTFEYILPQTTGKIFIDKKDPTSVLQKIAPLSEHTYVELSDGIGQNSDGLTLLDRPIPQLSALVYGVRLNGYFVMTKEYTKRWASIFYDDNGVLRLLSYIISPTFKKQREVSLISIDDALFNIQSGNGSILWLTQKTGEQYGVNPTFKQALLKRFSIVYIYDSNLLVPAYLFEGEGLSEAGDIQIFEVLVRAYRE